MPCRVSKIFVVGSAPLLERSSRVITHDLRKEVWCSGTHTGLIKKDGYLHYFVDCSCFSILTSVMAWDMRTSSAFVSSSLVSASCDLSLARF